MKGKNPGDFPIKFKEDKLGYETIETQTKFLQGKVLTVVEASLNGRQLEAVKSLINQQFSEQLDWLYELSHPEVRVLSEAQSIQIDYKEVEKALVKEKI